MEMKKLVSVTSLLVLLFASYECGILYPKPSLIRELVSLDGLWEFRLPNSNGNISDVDFTDVELMPVPSSYNDISTNSRVRDHVGIVQYRRRFVVPKRWQTKKVWIRFGSVCYAAEVYINGKLAVSHEIGHLPFVGEITKHLNYDQYNDITVIVNNTLTPSTIPQGLLSMLKSGRIKLTYTFDFLHYAGIDRPVVLYTTPNTYIEDITITTKVNGSSGVVNYDVSVEGDDSFTHLITVIDKEGNEIVQNGKSLSGTLEIPDVKLWWPYLMDKDPGYQYTLKVDIFDSDSALLDSYEQLFGVRELTWDNTTFKINGKAIYLRGFGRHEDSDIRGKGLDLPLIIRDHNLLKWIGGNSYRTSHYPYAEEIMDLADSLGIMIIDESPAVNTKNFNDGLLKNHKIALTELVQRDKNRPSVIIWSASNEPTTNVNTSEPYYREVIAHLRSLDSTRPVTVVNYVRPDSDYSGQFLDILSFNQYYGWYSDTGDFDVVAGNVMEHAESWHERHNKPVLVTEYGAEGLEGFHSVPAYAWSEETQTKVLSGEFEAFDQLRAKGWFIGEMIWNFADFKTKESAKRLGGNKKGVFTRQRQPKSSAHLLRKRYWALANELDGVDMPSDLDTYVIDTNSNDEL